MEEELSRIYYDPSNPAGFSSVNKLVKESGYKKSEVTDWLKSQLTYTLHKPIRKNFKREKIFVSKIDEQFEADLVDMQKFTKQNKGYKYILTVIDCFSKFAFAIPLKTKSSSCVSKALEVVFESRSPEKLRTDKGKEFLNRPVKNLCEKYGVLHFVTKEYRIKCAIVERFNRTLKSRMFKFFTSKGTYKYLDVLPDLVESYNNSIHRTIGVAPSQVNKSNEKAILKKVYGVSSRREYITRQSSNKNLKIGDIVRLKYDTEVFDKGFYPNWTDVKYKIVKVLRGPLFIVSELDGSQLNRRYYSHEIQKVSDGNDRVEKVIKRRRHDGNIQYFVKWLNYPSKYNSWVNAGDIFKL